MACDPPPNRWTKATFYAVAGLYVFVAFAVAAACSGV